MTISVATPSYKQLDWLRLCIASVRDQVEPPSAGISEIEYRRSEGAAPISSIPYPISVSPSDTPPLAVEHIIQDAGTPGIEDFAREVGADFYRDGQFVFSGKIENSECAIRDSELADDAERPTSRFQIPNYSLAIYSERDEGMYDAINRAWEKSRGNILCYLNCDEQYLPAALATVACEFELHPHIDIVFGDAIVISSEGSPLSYRRVVRPSAAHTRVVHLGTMSCSMFLQRKLFNDGLRFNTRWRAIGDADWVFNALQRTQEISMVRKPLAAFTLTGGNLGDNSLALTEAESWRASAPAVERMLTPLWRAFHFFKKFLAGAYSHRNLETAVYQMNEQSNRVVVKKRNISFSWPTGSDS